MDKERGGKLEPPLPFFKTGITAAARQAVRAYYLGEEVALSQAMETLNKALNELDGFKRFAESQLLRILCMISPVHFGASE